MAGMKTLIIIFVITFPVAMLTQEDVNHGVCHVPMNKEEEEFIKERERNRELMEEIAREIEMTCLDECYAGLHNCHDDAYCTNTKRSFTCTCRPGYNGDGVNCADINECSTGKHNCDVTSSVCYNTKGSFRCVCMEGYIEDGEDKCKDINECKAGKHNCGANANCQNNKGSFVCICKPGYSWDGVSCTDVDECALGIHICHSSRASCTNTVGSFNCSCNNPYTGDGRTCNIANGCQNYSSLNSSNRRITYPYNHHDCDSGIGPGWFRFEGSAGTRMPSSCPPTRRCGTIAPGWMNGSHPTVADGQVNRTVCFHHNGNCCYWSSNIKMRNCSSYYVYYLSGTPNGQCHLRYCGTN